MIYFKHILIILASFLLVCSVQGQNNDAKLRFEAVFGEENSEALTSLVNLFELSLQTKYSNNIDVAYQSYLTEIKSGKSPEIWHKKEKHKWVRKYLVDTEVWNEIWLKADSVWMEGNECCCKYRYKDFARETRSLSLSGDTVCSCEVLPNKYGLYFDALRVASQFDENVRDYLEAVEIAGVISPAVLASCLSSGNAKYYHEYFAKRFILLDIYLRGFWSE